MKEIERLQEHLYLIRKVAGWTKESLAEQLEISEEEVSKLEKNLIVLSQTQYEKIRSLLNKENTVSAILDMFVDNPENYSTEQKKEFLERMKTVLEKEDTKNRSKEILSILTVVGVIAIVSPLLIIGVTSGAFGVKSFFNKKR